MFRDEFVAITPGKGTFPNKFTMGRAEGSKAETPAHEVSFAYNFEIAAYEVPQKPLGGGDGNKSITLDGSAQLG